MTDTSPFVLEINTDDGKSTPLNVSIPVESILNITKGDKGDKGDQGIQGIQGIPGPTGGQTLYSDPNYVDFSYTVVESYGAGNEQTFDIPYGLVFAIPPYVDIQFVMFYPSEQWNNFGPNWTGSVNPCWTSKGQGAGNPVVKSVSRTQFVLGQPGLWASLGTMQINIKGFIDPVATAQNQKAKNITPPDSVKNVALASVSTTQGPIIPGQSSDVTLFQKLSNGNEVSCVFTAPPGAQGIKGDTGPAADPQIGRVDGFYNANCVPSTHLILNGSQFDQNQYPELYAKLGTNQLQDFRGVFLRGRDPNGQWDTNNTIDRNGSLNPTLESGSMLVGNHTGGDLFIEPNITWMKLFGVKNYINWDMNFPAGVIDGINQTGFATTPANGSNTPANSWNGINNGQGGVDQRLGMARPINMNVVWAIKASGGTSSTPASTNNSNFQAFTVTVAAHTTGSVTFPKPFSAAPIMVIPIVYTQDGQFDHYATVIDGSVTTTGCTLRFDWSQYGGGAGMDQTSVNYKVSILAIGQ